MVLNTKQRKALSDGEYGLPEERKFPLVDKAHVLKAIQFFKYCPPDKKKQLASNINKKAKEYGMKINCKGEFAKYISPDVAKSSTDESYCGFEYRVDEASNIGTLSPIVGGIPTESDEKEKLDEIDNIALGFSDEAFTSECFQGNKSNADRFAYMRGTQDMCNTLRDISQGHNNAFDGYIDSINVRLNKIMTNFELDCMFDYMTNDFKDREGIYNARNEVVEIINNDRIDDEERINRLVLILISHKKVNEFGILIQTIYLMDKCICTAVIEKLRHMVYDTYHNNFYAPYIDISDYINGDKSLKSEYSKHCPNTIINDLYYYGHDMYTVDGANLDHQVITTLINNKKISKDIFTAYSNVYAAQLLNAVRHMAIIGAIDWYAFIYYSKNVYAVNIGIDSVVYRLIQYEEGENNPNRRPKYIAYRIGYIEKGTKLMIDDQIIMSSNDWKKQTEHKEIRTHVIAMDPWDPGINHCKNCAKGTTEAMDFFNNDNSKNTVKGIHVDKRTNEPFLSIDPNTINEEYYKVCHTILDSNASKKNINMLKDNLCMVFYNIAIINNQAKEFKRGDNNIAMQELQRFRSMFIADFKTYLKFLEKELGHDFDFLDYFFKNRCNVNSKEDHDLFTKTYQTILYW